MSYVSINSALADLRSDPLGFLFRLGVLWRLIYGVLRIVLALALFHFVGTSVGEVIRHLMAHELIEDPQDIIIRFSYLLLPHLSFTINYFVALYFLAWGAIDVVLSVALLYERRYAFPLALALMGAVVLYEMHHLIRSQSLILATIIVVDIGVMWLITHEYLYGKKLHPQVNNPQVAE